MGIYLYIVKHKSLKYIFSNNFYVFCLHLLNHIPAFGITLRRNRLIHYWCSVQCAVWSVQCAVCCVQCAVCSVQCAVYSVQCTVCSVQFAVCSVQCAVFSVQYISVILSDRSNEPFLACHLSLFWDKGLWILLPWQVAGAFTCHKQQLEHGKLGYVVSCF